MLSEHIDQIPEREGLAVVAVLLHGPLDCVARWAVSSLAIHAA